MILYHTLTKKYNSCSAYFIQGFRYLSLQLNRLHRKGNTARFIQKLNRRFPFTQRNQCFATGSCFGLVSV